MATAAEDLQFVKGVDLTPARFTANQVAEAEALIQAYIQEYAPSLSLTKGTTLYDLVVRNAAVTYLSNKEQSLALIATQSLKAVTDNPDMASDAVVDAILSNLSITRRGGSKASGLVRLNLARTGTYQLSSSVQFVTAGGLIFQPNATYRITPDPESDEDLLLYSTDSSNSQFYALVPVTAAANGSEYQLADLTELTPNQKPPSFISSFAFGGFSGGEDDETNEEIIARIPEALAAKNLVSRSSIAGTLKTAFPTIHDVSVQGSNDQAMLRNANNLLSFKAGGFADIYVRSSQGVLRGTIQKVATLVDIDEANKFATYRVSLSRDEFPGHYAVLRITELGDALLGSFEILGETKGYTQDAAGRQVNKIPTTTDGVYTSYQTNMVLFRADYDESLGTTIEDQFDAEINVQVEVMYLPLIKEIQEYVNANSRRVILADYLVRAVVPCFVELGVIKVNGTEDADGEAVRLAIYNHINSLAIGSELRIDDLITVIRAVPEVKSVTLPVLLTGNIMAPDGTTLQIRSQSALEIPELPLQMVTPDTTAFFIETSDIYIQLSTS